MNEEVIASPLTLRVGGTRSIKVSDGFVTFGFHGTEMNVRASAITAYRLCSHIETGGVSVPAIELTAAALEYAIVNPCVEDWAEFKDAVKSYRTMAKGAFA